MYSFLLIILGIIFFLVFLFSADVDSPTLAMLSLLAIFLTIGWVLVYNSEGSPTSARDFTVVEVLQDAQERSAVGVVFEVNSEPRFVDKDGRTKNFWVKKTVPYGWYAPNKKFKNLKYREITRGDLAVVQGGRDCKIAGIESAEYSRCQRIGDVVTVEL